MVMDMRTGLMFEVEKAGLPQKEKEKIVLENSQGWNPPWSKHGGISQQKEHGKPSFPPLHRGRKMKICWIFS
jgi:hypothetical protein